MNIYEDSLVGWRNYFQWGEKEKIPSLIALLTNPRPAYCWIGAGYGI